METVDAWKQMKRFLKPRSLIPALVQCNQPVDPKQVKTCNFTCVFNVTNMLAMRTHHVCMCTNAGTYKLLLFVLHVVVARLCT